MYLLYCLSWHTLTWLVDTTNHYQQMYVCIELNGHCSAMFNEQAYMHVKNKVKSYSA